MTNKEEVFLEFILNCPLFMCWLTLLTTVLRSYWATDWQGEEKEKEEERKSLGVCKRLLKKGNTKFTVLKVPRECRLVFVSKIGWRQGLTLEREEGKMAGSRMLEHVTEERSLVWILNFMFRRNLWRFIYLLLFFFFLRFVVRLKFLRLSPKGCTKSVALQSGIPITNIAQRHWWLTFMWEYSPILFRTLLYLKVACLDPTVRLVGVVLK